MSEFVGYGKCAVCHGELHLNDHSVVWVHTNETDCKTPMLKTWNNEWIEEQ